MLVCLCRHPFIKKNLLCFLVGCCYLCEYVDVDLTPFSMTFDSPTAIERLLSRHNIQPTDCAGYCLCLAGERTMLINSRSYTLRRGRLYVVSPIVVGVPALNWWRPKSRSIGKKKHGADSCRSSCSPPKAHCKGHCWKGSLPSTYRW